MNEPVVPLTRRAALTLLGSASVALAQRAVQTPDAPIFSGPAALGTWNGLGPLISPLKVHNRTQAAVYALRDGLT